MTRSCLVIKNDGVGDLIASSGIIASLAEHYGGALDLVVTQAQAEVAGLIPGVRRAYLVSRDGLRHIPGLRDLGLMVPMTRGSLADWRTDFGVLTRLASQHYDVAIVLRRFIRASSFALMGAVRAEQKYLAYQFPTNVRANVARTAARGWHLHQGAPEVLSEIEYLARFTETCSGAAIDPRPRLALPTAQVAPQQAQLGFGLGGSSMRWGVDAWIELGRALCEQGYMITLFGGADALEDAACVQAALPRCRSLVGSRSLPESVGELSALDAYLGNDTGFSHFAALIVSRCLVVCGGGTFGRFFPWPGAANQYVVFHGMDCFDCNWQCKYSERRCLTRLRASHVLRGFQEMMAPGWKGPSVRNAESEADAYTLAWRFRDRPLPVRFDRHASELPGT